MIDVQCRTERVVIDPPSESVLAQFKTVIEMDGKDVDHCHWQVDIATDGQIRGKPTWGLYLSTASHGRGGNSTHHRRYQTTERIRVNIQQEDDTCWATRCEVYIKSETLPDRSDWQWVMTDRWNSPVGAMDGALNWLVRRQSAFLGNICRLAEEERRQDENRQSVVGRMNHAIAEVRRQKIGPFY